MHPDRDIKTLARLITRLEESPGRADEVIREVGLVERGVFVIGVTGPPGSGKSTLVDQMIHVFREEKKKVGVISIDPSSPFTGGALLGDRIRMQRHEGDGGVFIRSISSRGSHGGVSKTTGDVVRLYKAFGFDVIIVETVGVGQTELDIANIADIIVVVLTPESGDSIQVLKAGILEIADILVVNKSDRDGAEEMRQLLMSIKDTPAFLTQAIKGEGVVELVKEINTKRL